MFSVPLLKKEASFFQQPLSQLSAIYHHIRSEISISTHHSSDSVDHGNTVSVRKNHFRYTQSHIILCIYLASGPFGFICRCCQDESEIWENYMSLWKDSGQDEFFGSLFLLILNLWGG